MKPTLLQRLRHTFPLFAALALSALLLNLTGIGCLLRYLTGISCPGCGMSRAVYALLTLDFTGALRHHPLVFLLIPGVLYCLLATYPLMGSVRRQNALVMGVVVLFCGVYLYRLLPMRDPVLLWNWDAGLLHHLYSPFLP